MEHSKIIMAMKELQAWRFVMLWVWLMSMAAVPVLTALAMK